MIEYKNFTNECGIYCFKNLINNKHYVGQAVNLKKRLRSHYGAIRQGTNPQLAFYRAVAKYGIENFDLFIAEFVDPATDHLKDVLDDLEKKYIKIYNSYVPNGYNMTLGGDAGVLGLKMTDEQKEKISKAATEQAQKRIKHIWARKISEPKYYYGWTYDEASAKSGVSKSQICHVCNKTSVHPYVKGWTFADDEQTLFDNCVVAFHDMANHTYSENGGRFQKGDKHPTVLQLHTNRPVIELDESGNIIKEYEKVKDVVEELQCNPHTFSGYLHRENQLKFMNRIFKFKNPVKKHICSKERLEQLHTQSKKYLSKKVGQYDLEGNFLQAFDSIREAADSINGHGTDIVKVCKGKCKTSKGFIWKYL